MHICFLTNEYPKSGFPHGGLGSFVKTMVEALVKNGIQVTVVGLNYISANETESVNGVSIIRIRKSKVKGLAWYFNSKNIAKTIATIHKENPIDIVEGAELSFAFLPKIKEIKYVIRLHGGHHFFAEGESRGIHWWKGFQEKRSFKKADAFIAVSNYVKSHTAKYLSYHNAPISIIYYPINDLHFQPQEIAIEVNNKAQPKLYLITLLIAEMSVLILFKIHKVTKAAGTLPRVSQPVIFQLIFPFLLCTNTPPALVKAAYSKSVPTAVVGEMPKYNKIGVIKEPPPTPVKPTIKPTPKPAII